MQLELCIGCLLQRIPIQNGGGNKSQGYLYDLFMTIVFALIFLVLVKVFI